MTGDAKPKAPKKPAKPARPDAPAPAPAKAKAKAKKEHATAKKEHAKKEHAQPENATPPFTKRSFAVAAENVRAAPPPEPTSTADSLAAARAFLIGVAPTKAANAKSAVAKPRAKPAAAPETVEVAEDPASEEFDRRETLRAPPRAHAAVASEPAASEPAASDAPTPVMAAPPPSSAEIADEIRALEQRLDRMIEEVSRPELPTADVPPTPLPPSYAAPASVPAPAASGRSLGEAGETVFETARELLTTDFYLRKWGRMGMRNRSEEVDDFGFDPVYEQKVRGAFNFLYEKYFRVECEGIEKIPAEGRCLLVSNHSGTVPFDGVMIKTAVKREHPRHRDVRWLAEDFIFHFPFLGAFSNRVGAVRACQENAERLLKQEALVTVFPEGVKGIGKLWKERYRLQRFGRGGFIKLCLRTGTPIVPVAVVGGEETNPMLLRVEVLSKLLGLPYLPVTPTFPALGLLGLAPAPTKWRILFGDPITLDHGAEAADDEILVGRLSERVRATIQGMLDRAVTARRSVWFG